MRLRLQHFIVQPVLVNDDGDELQPGPVVEPRPFTLAALKALADEWPDRLTELEQQAQEATT